MNFKLDFMTSQVVIKNSILYGVNKLKFLMGMCVLCCIGEDKNWTLREINQISASDIHPSVSAAFVITGGILIGIFIPYNPRTLLLLANGAALAPLKKRNTHIRPIE